MKVFIHFNGGLVPDTDIDVNLVAIKRNDTSTKIDTLYNFVYKKYVFTVERDYLRFEDSEKHIRYDNRIIGNANRKELPNKSYSFIKKYFILDTGEDDIYLIPIIKNRY